MNDVSRRNELSILAILKRDPSNKSCRVLLGLPDGGLRGYVLATGTDWPTLGLGDNLARRVADRICLSHCRTTFHAYLPVVRGVQQ